MQQTHSFSIENAINPDTEKPFGTKYTGTFSVRQVSLRDKMLIAQRETAELNVFGPVPPGSVPVGLEFASHISIFVKAVATADLPGWFDLSKIFDEEGELALLAVWQEVQTFQNSFRVVHAGGAGE